MALVKDSSTSPNKIKRTKLINSNLEALHRGPLHKVQEPQMFIILTCWGILDRLELNNKQIFKPQLEASTLNKSNNFYLKVVYLEMQPLLLKLSSL